MPLVKPFRALRYNLATVAAPAADVVCPPYDVIDPAMQNELYERNPFNIVRIEFGKSLPNDAAGDDKYSRGAQLFNEWLAKNILAQDPREAFYLYEQTFDIAYGGASRSKFVTRRGIFGAVKLEPFGTGSVY